MTSAPVPLAEQIELVRSGVEMMSDAMGAKATRDLGVLSAVLATLQQHERAMAVVEAVRRYQSSWNTLAKDIRREKMFETLAALDSAANTAGDAVTTEEER